MIPRTRTRGRLFALLYALCCTDHTVMPLRLRYRIEEIIDTPVGFATFLWRRTNSSVHMNSNPHQQGVFLPSVRVMGIGVCYILLVQCLHKDVLTRSLRARGGGVPADKPDTHGYTYRSACIILCLVFCSYSVCCRPFPSGPQAACTGFPIYQGASTQGLGPVFDYLKLEDL